MSKRIGNLSGGVADIKTHPWFRTLDWDACLARRASAPIKYVTIKLATQTLMCSAQPAV